MFKNFFNYSGTTSKKNESTVINGILKSSESSEEKEVRFVDQLKDITTTVEEGKKIGGGEVLRGDSTSKGERIELVRIPASQMTTERLLKNKLEFKSLGSRKRNNDSNHRVAEALTGRSELVDGGTEAVSEKELRELLQHFEESIKNSPHNHKNASRMNVSVREKSIEVHKTFKEVKSSCEHCGEGGERVVQLMKELQATTGRLEALQQQNNLLISQQHKNKFVFC